MGTDTVPSPSPSYGAWKAPHLATASWSASEASDHDTVWSRGGAWLWLRERMGHGSEGEEACGGGYARPVGRGVAKVRTIHRHDKVLAAPSSKSRLWSDPCPVWPTLSSRTNSTGHIPQISRFLIASSILGHLVCTVAPNSTRFRRGEIAFSAPSMLDLTARLLSLPSLRARAARAGTTKFPLALESKLAAAHRFR